MKKRIILPVIMAINVSACAIPGIGPYASQTIDLFINKKFTNTRDPGRNEVGSLYSKVAKGEIGLYRTEPEETGTRYFFRYYYERCKYSLYVDENDIIRSWRDEGGTSHMNRCLVR